jgi:hypothetical protein
VGQHKGPGHAGALSPPRPEDEEPPATVPTHGMPRHRESSGPPRSGSFEALVVDNLDIGRPDHVKVIFAGHPAAGDGPKVEPTYKTRIYTQGTIGVTVNADYKRSRVKQYLRTAGRCGSRL